MAEASRYLKLPASTLRSWAGSFIRRPQKKPTLLTFWNLIEAHMLRSLRTKHGVSTKAVRAALTYAARSAKVERLHLHKDLRTDPGSLFLEKYGELIELSASGQLAMRKTFEAHVGRVVWDGWGFPVRLYPFVPGTSEIHPIAIDPQIAFGRPVVLRSRVSTGIVAERIDAGETVADLADDYDLSTAEIEAAVLYERTC